MDFEIAKTEWFHTGAHIDWVIRLLKEKENTKSKIVSTGGKFLSSEETIELLQKQKEDGKLVICGDCDNHDEKGYCQGHKERV